MEAKKLVLSLVLAVSLLSPQINTATTCKSIKETNRNAPSGIYPAVSWSGVLFQIYCEMGLNGGGYTFLHPVALSLLSQAELSSMFTDRTSLLVRVRLTNGTQPYSVLSQLREYKDIPLMLGLNNYTGYTAPINEKIIGEPYLYAGFIPQINSFKNNFTGLEVNGVRIAFRKCLNGSSSHITLFPNYREVQPFNTTDTQRLRMCTIMTLLLPVPSGRVMPAEYFLFEETEWGKTIGWGALELCGCYAQTNQFRQNLGLSIGFK